MLHFTLCKPIILDTQVPQIAHDLGYDLNDLMDVLMYSKVAVKTESGEYEIQSLTAESSVAANMSKPAGNQYYGPEAIINICKDANFEIHPLTEINVPVDVYYESCPMVWDDICFLFARAENRNFRLAKLIDMEAPEIILRNETRMLMEYIEMLEHNKLYSLSGGDVKQFTDKNGEVYRSLNDVGYSLITGWTNQKLEEFDKRSEEAGRRISEMLSEEIKNTATLDSIEG